MIVKDISEELISLAHQGQDSKSVWSCPHLEYLEWTGDPENKAIQLDECIWNYCKIPVWVHGTHNPLIWAFLKNICSLLSGKRSRVIVKNFADLLCFQLPNSNARLVTIGWRIDHDKKFARSNAQYAIIITRFIECFLCARHGAKP